MQDMRQAIFITENEMCNGYMPERTPRRMETPPRSEESRGHVCVDHFWVDEVFYLLNWETFLKRGPYRSGSSATGSASRISFLAYRSASSGAILQNDG
jgi:hypothetical protein